MSKLFRVEDMVLVCLSIISKDLGEIKEIEETNFKERLRQLCEKHFKVKVVSDRELENYFERWVSDGLINKKRMSGDRRKTFYVINKDKVRTENMTVIYLPNNKLVIHDTVAGILLEGQWATRYSTT